MKLRRWAMIALFAASAGCMQKQVRSQMADDADHEVEVRTIGDLTAVSNAHGIPVIGVGLVTGLPGTGGGVPPGNERAQLENDLKKLNVSNISELFTSKTTSLVRVQAMIPAGARKQDPIDVNVQVPDSCRTTSLRGGKLEVCWLYSFESSQNLSPDPTRGDRLLRGHPMVKAEGSILAGLTAGDGDDTPSLKAGKVWSGGKVLLPDRPFLLEINAPSVKAAVGIAARVNETFHGPGSSAAPIAVAKNDTHVVLNVPGAYRLNLGRFLRVVRLIPLEGVPRPTDAYTKKVAEQLRDRKTCVTAALRLEALGVQSIPQLKVALQSDEQLVRFTAAESLAYLGSPACAEELAKQAVEEPMVRAYALTALASLNEAVCKTKLYELLAADAPDVRFGAYRALRALDEHDPQLQGEKIGSTFHLHCLAPTSAPQVHASTGKRAEVVLFGRSPTLVAPFSILAGPEFVITAKEGETHCTVSRYSVRGGTQSRPCGFGLAEVLRTIGELEGTYVDVLELLRQADSARALNCAVKIDALPKAPEIHDIQALAATGQPAHKATDKPVGLVADSRSKSLVSGPADDAKHGREPDAAAHR